MVRRITLLLGALLFAAFAATPAAAQNTISIAEARNQGVDATVTVEGTVTRAFGAYARIQDASGPTGASALVIRQTSGSNSDAFQSDISDGTIQPGTVLRVSGTLSEFNGLLQINGGDLDSYSVESQGDPPAPQSVTLDELDTNGEDYESELVTVNGIAIVSASGTFENNESYTVENDAGNALTFRVQRDDETALGGTPIPEGTFTYTGVTGQFRDEYQLIPVRPSDLQESRSFSFGRLFSNAQEGEGAVSVEVRAFNLQAGDNVSVTARVGEASTATNGTDVTGFTSPQTLTFSGPDPAPQTLSFDIVDDSETEGVERLEVTLESDDGAIASPSQFTLWIRDDATAQGTIAGDVSGDDLIDQLQATFGDPPTIGYDVARDSMYATIYNDGGTVEGLYTGFQVTVDPAQGDPSTQAFNQGVNTEHLWPRSQGSEQEPALSNMHILAPVWEDANSARCNYPYAEIADTDTERWFGAGTVQSNPPPEAERAAFSESVGSDCGNPSPDGRFEPRHSVKGDVARAAFYFVTVYPNRANLQFYEAQKETLFDWHQQDPVDAVEMRRNILQASYQGNKLNPFIVDPTLIDRAYFSGGGSPGGDVLAISEARAQGGGSTVTVEGVVTRVGPEGAYLQDDTAGLYIFQEDGAFNGDLGGSIRAGTRLQVTGSLEFYNGLLELTDVPDDRYQVLSQDNALPEAPTLTLSEIASNGEDYEAELVRVENFTIDDKGNDTFRAGGSQGNYPIDDGTAELTLRIPSGSEWGGEPIPERATFEGVLGQFNGAGFGADEPDDGYQLTALRIDDLPETITIPETIVFDITRGFGDAGDPSSYQLVALPGAVDRPVENTLSGSAGSTWQAYWDNGESDDYLVKHDGSDTFVFRPGRGFWLISQSDWTVSGDLPTVNLSANLTAEIPLHDGWNIISNPLDRDVPWSAVEAANSATLQTIWRFDGAFNQASTFTSATAGTAFYFRNNQGLDALQIPYPTGSLAATKSDSEMPTFRLTATFGDGTASSVQIDTRAEAEAGLDRFDQVAPSVRFESGRLRITCESCSDPRQQLLATDVRPSDPQGHTYSLVLERSGDAPVTLRAANVQALSHPRAILQEVGTDRSYDLRADSTVQLRPSGDTMRLRLLVGTASYVEDERVPSAPEKVALLPNYPNPFSERTTIEYALPEPQEVRLAVYDALGRRVRVLVDERQSAGTHQVRWNGTTASGRQAASGLYLIRLEAGATEQTRKMVLIR